MFQEISIIAGDVIESSSNETGGKKTAWHQIMLISELLNKDRWQSENQCLTLIWALKYLAFMSVQVGTSNFPQHSAAQTIVESLTLSTKYLNVVDSK